MKMGAGDGKKRVGEGGPGGWRSWGGAVLGWERAVLGWERAVLGRGLSRPPPSLNF